MVVVKATTVTITVTTIETTIVTTTVTIEWTVSNEKKERALKKKGFG